MRFSSTFYLRFMPVLIRRPIMREQTRQMRRQSFSQEAPMTLAKRWNSRMIALVALVLTAGLLVVLGHRDGGEVREALAAQPSQQAPTKAQARQAFDRII